MQRNNKVFLLLICTVMILFTGLAISFYLRMGRSYFPESQIPEALTSTEDSVLKQMNEIADQYGIKIDTRKYTKHIGRVYYDFDLADWCSLYNMDVDTVKEQIEALSKMAERTEYMTYYINRVDAPYSIRPTTAYDLSVMVDGVTIRGASLWYEFDGEDMLPGRVHYPSGYSVEDVLNVQAIDVLSVVSTACQCIYNHKGEIYSGLDMPKYSSVIYTTEYRYSTFDGEFHYCYVFYTHGDSYVAIDGESGQIVETYYFNGIYY